MFILKEIIWAKVKGYPWWPAEISKLPSQDQNYFRVSFIGESNHALLQSKAIRKYTENYQKLKSIKCKGLSNSIALADEIIKKYSIQNQTVPIKNLKEEIESVRIFKTKKIIRKNIKKQKFRKKQQLLKYSANSQKKQNADEAGRNMQIMEDEGKQASSPEIQKQSKPLSKSNDLQNQFLNGYLSEDQLQEKENQRGGIVDRKKIQSFEEQLIHFIAEFNSQNYQNMRKCFLAIENLENQFFKPQELRQSKITNMISYIQNVFEIRENKELNQAEIQKIRIINLKLKQQVVRYLENGSYYEYFLKKMRKCQAYKNTEGQSKDQNLFQSNFLESNRKKIIENYEKIDQKINQRELQRDFQNISQLQQQRNQNFEDNKIIQIHAKQDKIKQQITGKKHPINEQNQRNNTNELNQIKMQQKEQKQKVQLKKIEKKKLYEKKKNKLMKQLTFKEQNTDKNEHNSNIKITRNSLTKFVKLK